MQGILKQCKPVCAGKVGLILRSLPWRLDAEAGLYEYRKSCPDRFFWLKFHRVSAEGSAHRIHPNRVLKTMLPYPEFSTIIAPSSQP